MAVSIDNLSNAEPSSDFPTEDDSGPCSRLSRGSGIACVIGFALVVGAIAFLLGRSIARRSRA
jgi:hypothetical protein